jgi:membrane associated rhomboid family serine protease
MSVTCEWLSCWTRSMPKCVTCGAEAPREEMYGYRDELRCRACAQKSYAPFVAPRVRAQAKMRAPITITIIVAAVVASALYWSMPTDAGRFLIAEPVPVWRGQLWRLFTCVFPHGNPLHLIFNLYWIWRFGRVLEAWMGTWRYAGFIALTAFGSSAAQFLVASGGIGLSGVGYAFFGLLYALRRDKGFAAEEMQPQVVQLIVGWFFLCILLTYTGLMLVGNVAHGAGAVLGWCVGRSALVRQRNYFVAGLSLLVFALVWITQEMPWNGDYAWYRGERYAQREDYRNALPWYRKALRAHPDNPELAAYVRWLEQVVEHSSNQNKAR